MKFVSTILPAAFLLAGLATTAARGAELIQNGSFEATLVAGSAGTSGGYAYPTGTFDGWTYDEGAGLIDSVTGTAWFGNSGGGSPQGFDGGQYAFLQTSGTLSQTFTADATGLLSISWLESGRPHSIHNSGNQTYTVAIDSSVLGTFSTSAGQAFTARSASPFAVVAGASYTLTFQGYSVYDNTAFLDNVSASVAPVPEPGEWAMMAAGLGIVGAAARKRRRTA